MKVIIAGSRNVKFTLEELDTLIVKSEYKITEVISGGAKGIDKLGERWAAKHEILLSVYHADWETYGKKAGILRNKQMVDHADALIAVWDGQSHGTQSTIKFAHEKQIPVIVVIVDPKLEQTL
jgi:predicted Rossmann fold nucleotide-binding protein DprA/Smf involved in DNA uptake